MMACASRAGLEKQSSWLPGTCTSRNNPSFLGQARMPWVVVWQRGIFRAVDIRFRDPHSGRIDFQRNLFRKRLKWMRVQSETLARKRAGVAAVPSAAAFSLVHTARNRIKSALWP